MKENKRIRRTQMKRWGSGLLVFIIVNVVLRALLLPINAGEYTDGILQLTQFYEPTAIWPPLYTALCWPLSLLVGEMWSGRIVSVLFSSAAVIPIYLIALRCFGARSAVFAALVYTVSPVSLRWAPRVMTDATFSFFFWCACDRILAAQAAMERNDANKALAWACAWGTLATATRYQGFMLIPPVLAVAIYHWVYHRFFPAKGVLSILFYSLLLPWLLHVGMLHGRQFDERTAGLGTWMTFLITAEPFVLYMPYFLTYPVALLTMLGMNRGRSRPRHSMMPLTLYVFVVLLVAQSLFASFQERYFLPFFGLCYIYAGLGMAIVDYRYWRRAPRLRPYIPILTCAWSLFVAALVLIGSREAFSDVRAAAKYVKSLAPQDDEERVYTNEGWWNIHTRATSAPQMRFFSGRMIYSLGDEYIDGRIPLRKGDLVVLSSRYDNGTQMPRLMQHYRLQRLGMYSAAVTPVFPDIMSIPGTDQSMMAWAYRYVPQNFSTAVYRVEGMTGR
ncbi:glycosyltransferase family 39 protein [Candidatus Sumerlaeota bacterium]|nr:glycosyltransferase family 39 protein [Candidatus Sumerlaeota bacterium]